MVDLLSGMALQDHVIKIDKKTGLHAIVAGKTISNPSNMLGSGRMERILDAISESYDFLVVDSPPTFALNDPHMLARMVDTSIFVVTWGKIRRESAVSAIKKFTSSGASIAGVVLNRVVPKKYAQYDYAVSGGFYKKHMKYYVPS